MTSATAPLKELAEQIVELEELGDDDDDIVTLIRDTKQGLTAAATKIAEAAGFAVVPAAALTAAAATELRWDDGNWYPCRVIAAQYDAVADAVLATAYVVGYGLEETVALPRLRAWQPPEVALMPGVRCHAVHPSTPTGAFHEARVDRVAIKGTVWVTFAAAEGCPAATVELPPSLVHLGKHYQRLQKKAENMSHAEKAQKELDDRRRKKAKAEAKVADVHTAMDKTASEWGAFSAAVGKPKPRVTVRKEKR
jgi:hypothetical protein